MYRIVLISVMCVLFICCLCNAGFAFQPALDLPAWVNLDLRFSAPPVLGMSVELSCTLDCLHGDGLQGVLSVTLPKEIELIKGETRREVLLNSGARYQLNLLVKVARPCRSDVRLRLLAPYPRMALADLVRVGGCDDSLTASRLDFIEGLGSRQHVFSRRIALFVSGFEALWGNIEPRWTMYRHGPGGEGLFVMKAPAEVSINILEQRTRAFEQAERLLAARPELKKSLAEKRKALISRYCDDLYSLAALDFINKGASAEPTVKSCMKKALSKAAMSAETLSAFQNLSALVSLWHGKLEQAARIWTAARDFAGRNGLAAYLLFNRGESLRIEGLNEAARSLFQEALRIRPGLTIAGKRLLK